MKNNMKKILFCVMLFFSLSNNTMVSKSFDRGEVLKTCYLKCLCFIAKHQKRSAVLLSAAFFVCIAYRCYKNLFFKQGPTLDKQEPVVQEEQAPTVQSQTFVPQESVSAVQEENPPVSSQTPIIEAQVLAKSETESALKESEPAVKKYTGLQIVLLPWGGEITRHGFSNVTDQTPVVSRSTVDTTGPAHRFKKRRDK